MRAPYLVFLFILHAISSIYASNEVRISKYPSWAVDNIIKESGNPQNDDGGMKYLLIDKQINISTQENYIHIVIEISNAESIESASDITLNYDPAFQTLSFHKVNIIRNGKVIDKLKDHTINTFQREHEMERNIYDGSYTAVINLTDVRVGDILEYAYTFKGFNPIYNGNFYDQLFQEYGVNVDQVFSRLLTNKKLYFRYENSASEPKVQKLRNATEYTWDIQNPETIIYDNNIPPWYNPAKLVECSTFSSWSEVTQWALPHYQFSKKPLTGVTHLLEKSEDEQLIEKNIINIIRFVQDEVRYLGFESGISAYKPNRPATVLGRRFGDCKDKSLLLVTLLAEIGIEAYPVYVNTVHGPRLNKMLPSPQVFDHVVVMIEYDNKVFFVDPTINNQGGNMENIYFPNYGYGLIIKANSVELTKLPEKMNSTTTSKELLVMKDFQSDVKYTIRTEYTGRSADVQRQTFDSNNIESIQKEYLNFYSNLFPGIKKSENIKIFDYERNSDNLYIVEEYYWIEDIWQFDEESSLDYIETYPLILDNYTNIPKSATRTMPYYFGEPYEIENEIIIELPEAWTVENTFADVEGAGFKYENKITSAGNTIVVNHKYEVNKNIIPAEQAADVIQKHDDIRASFSYFLTRNKELSKYKLSLISIAIVILSLGAAIWLAYKLYQEYNPEPWAFAENKPIGSWLILVALGIVISPFRLAYDIFADENIFNANMWLVFLHNYNLPKAVLLVLIVFVEMVYNCFFFVFSLLIAILYFSRRTSLPRLFTIYLMVNFTVVTLDAIALRLIAPELITDADLTQTYQVVGRALFASLIWIPYFNISERVKSTFCNALE